MQPVPTVYSTRDRTLVAPSGRATIARRSASSATARTAIGEVIDDRRRGAETDGFETAITGELTADEDFSTLSEEDLQKGELQFGLPVGAARPAPRLRRRRRGPAPGARGARLDRRRARAHRAPRPGVRPLGLRRQHDLGDGPRPRDRLLAVRRLTVPRGAAARGSEKLDAIARRRLDRVPRRALQRLGVRARDGGDGAGARTPSCAASPRERSSSAIVTVRRGAHAAARPCSRCSATASTRSASPGSGGAIEASAGAEGRVWSRVVGAVMRAPVLAAAVAAGALLARWRCPCSGSRPGSPACATCPTGSRRSRASSLLEEEFGVGTVDSVEVVVEGDVRSTRRAGRDRRGRSAARSGPGVPRRPRSR